MKQSNGQVAFKGHACFLSPDSGTHPTGHHGRTTPLRSRFQGTTDFGSGPGSQKSRVFPPETEGLGLHTLSGAGERRRGAGRRVLTWTGCPAGPRTLASRQRRETPQQSAETAPGPPPAPARGHTGPARYLHVHLSTKPGWARAPAWPPSTTWSAEAATRVREERGMLRAQVAPQHCPRDDR